jgi:hypothetical protein
VGPRAVLGAVVKNIPSPSWESNPRTLIVQPVAQSYGKGIKNVQDKIKPDKIKSI